MRNSNKEHVVGIKYWTKNKQQVSILEMETHISFMERKQSSIMVLCNDNLYIFHEETQKTHLKNNEKLINPFK
jgi:hypothetical protein